MSFFKNFRAELGTGAGKGFNAVIASLWKILCMFCGWLFTWQHRKGEPSLHTNSFRIAVWSLIIALFTVPGLVRVSSTPIANPSTQDTQAVIVLEVHPGECVTVPPNILTKIAVRSLPISFENMKNIFYVKGADGVERPWQWTLATSGNYVADGSKQIITTMGGEGGGKLCF